MQKIRKSLTRRSNRTWVKDGNGTERWRYNTVGVENDYKRAKSDRYKQNTTEAARMMVTLRTVTLTFG